MFDKSAKILLADDFLTMRNVMKKILNEQGYTNIFLAVDGTDAKNQIKRALEAKTPFDMVICDWNMPNMSGLELLKMIRGSAETNKLPFIMVTAESEQPQIIDAVRCGVSEYVVKPFSTTTFVEKLNRVVAKLNQPTKVA